MSNDKRLPKAYVLAGFLQKLSPENIKFTPHARMARMNFRGISKDEVLAAIANAKADNMRVRRAEDGNGVAVDIRNGPVMVALVLKNGIGTVLTTFERAC